MLALRLLGEDHALEPGRSYRLGRGGHCDLRIDADGVADCQAELWLQDGELRLRQLDPLLPTLVNGVPATAAGLQIGDRLGFGAGAVEARVVRDLGLARIVPDPALVAARHGEPPAAAPPRPRRPAASWLHRSAAAMPLRRQGEATFTDLLADELRRAPWFLLSLLVHAVLLLLALWLTQRPVAGHRSLEVGWLGAQGPTPTEAREQGPPVEVREEQPQLPPIPDPAPMPNPEPTDVAMQPPPMPAPLWPMAGLQQNPRVGARAGGKSGGDGDVLQRGGQGLDSGGFRRTVSELRESGLEIVFVFDSTGSMGGMIDGTKQSIDAMLEVLQALVPSARFGLVTYRDTNRREDYAVRSLPLGDDFWRARNFMQTVEAGGGGDRPEAVLEGLQAAFAQGWQPGARRVVILAGDAPAHPDSEAELQRSVQRFCRDRRSSVHAVITGNRQQVDVQQSFARVAKWGGGLCVPFEEQRRLMQLVLSLAFGRQYERNIDQVYALVADEAARTSSQALDLARSGGEPLLAALQQRPVPPALVRALVQRPRRGTAAQLAQLLGDDRAPASSRHAAAWVLQHVLELPQPPIDAEAPVPAKPQLVEQLLRLADRLPE